MTRSILALVVWAAALVVVIVLFFRDWVAPIAPSRKECVSLWNAPGNERLRAQVEKLDYPKAEIDGVFSEERYQGCYAIFAGDVGDPWALYGATRIPGTKTRLTWRLDARAERWGIGFPPPWDRPRPNALVQSDGSISLAGVIEQEGDAISGN